MPTSSWAARLPDVYAKDDGTVNSRMLELNRMAIEQGLADVLAVEEAVSLNLATGATLDLYGEMVGQPRGSLEDSQYRVMIRNRVARNFVVGDYESVVQAIATMLESDAETIVFDDDPGESGRVRITSLPYGVLTHAGFSVGQALQLIDLLLPAGVGLSEGNLEGSFAFAAEDGEYDEGAGFAISHEDQSIGGYLGFMMGEDEDSPLPIV